ncbi:hypothetical protein BGZ68_008891 [Mortierella alpina]|nr:hypothetical protein BGZ68_008891 [Mortierella alpina]
MVMSLMSMLLWRRIRLPNRLWNLHTLCRVLFSTAITVFALIYPITELRFVLERNQGWAIYFCQIRPPPPPQWGSDLRGIPLVSKGTIASRPLDGSLQTQDSWARNCAVLRARSVLTVMWVLLILVEICIAYRAKEFQSRDDLGSKHGHWSKARIDRLIKASMDSSSEVWSEEIVRPHNDDNGEDDVRGNHETDSIYDYEETSTQYDQGQQRRSLQEYRYSHSPPEYHYAYRVEVLEPALPPFVYNPFLRQSDCSFACLDMSDSVTTGSSITISSIDSLDSQYGPYGNQNSEVSRPRLNGCL